MSAAVRVSSPDRVIYEATERTGEVTKLMVAEYFASVEDGLMRALRDRPTALERWPSGVREGMQLATGRADKDADAFYQKRVPKGAPDYLESVEITFPSGRTAEEICPTEIAVPVWCAHMGTLSFHPWPVRRSDVDHPDELRIDLDPQPGTTFADARRVAGVAKELLEELGLVGFAEDVRQPGHPHLRADRAALGVHRRPARRDRVRPRARPPRRRRHDGLVEGGARGAHLRRLQPEQPGPDHRVGLLAAPQARRPGLDADDLGRARRGEGPARLQPVHGPGPAWPTATRGPSIDDTAYSLEPLLKLWEELPGGEMNFPPDYPKMPGEPPRVQPSKKVEAHWDADGNRIGD